MGSAYGGVLRRRDVLAALVPYVFARLPLSMSLLALLLLVRSQSGSFHRAGLVCAVYGAAVAVTAPLLGRLVDRRGQSRVLVACAFVHPAAMVTLALAADHRRFALVMAAAVVAGASLPPVSSCMRVLWSLLLGNDVRSAGYAIEGVVVEVAELTGPLLVSAATLLGRPSTAVVISGAMTGCATLLFSRSRASRSVPASDDRRTLAGALGVAGVRVVLGLVLTSTATVGAVEVAVAAFARAHGGSASAGLYIALISAGGIVAGLVAGSSGRLSNRSRPVFLAALLMLSALASAALGVATGIASFAPALVAFGAIVAVGVIVQLAMMARIAPAVVRTEAFTWGSTANFVGLAAGTMLAGSVVDRWGLRGAFFVAAVPSAAAGLISLAAARVLASNAVDGQDADEGREAGDVRAAGADTPPVAGDGAEGIPMTLLDDLRTELTALRERVSVLEAELAAPVDDRLVEDARQRSRRMLDRADAACLELRERAEDDAARVREAATTASLEILAAAERDARAVLDRARREAESLVARARRAAPRPGATSPVASGRPVLLALPGIGLVPAEPDEAGEDADRGTAADAETR